MKIQVKSIEMVETEILKDITVSDTITKRDKHFQDVIDYLKTLEFVASSCRYNNFETHISFGQGGCNWDDLDYIRLIHNYQGKLTFEVRWTHHKKDYDGAIIILNEPLKD